jgi:DNA-binding transcriptional MocR family regulator
MLKYRTLYERYRKLIERGVYAPGERLPSLRDAAEAEGVGLNTARAAFDLLEGDGLALPLERGGYYVRGRPPSCLPSPSAPDGARETEGLSAAQKIDLLLAEGGASAGFALAEPDASLLPVGKLEKLGASVSGDWISYGPQEGEEELRRRIAAAYYPYHGALAAEDIVVTNGATEGIGIALRAIVASGDTVAVESPTYYDFFRQLSALRARILEIPLRPGLGMDLGLLESRLRARKVRCIIAQPNVQNPTGTIMGEPEKRRLVELASRYGAYLVQDDVYGDLAFSHERPANLSAYGDYERLVYLSSFSKSLAPGLRVGWVCSRLLRPELLRTKSLCSLSTNRPAQRVVASYLASGAFRKHLAVMRGELESQRDDYLELLSSALPEGSAIARPEGGCLLWIALPAGVDASRLFAAAARERIFFAPGELFSGDPFFGNCLRINFGYRLNERRRTQLARLCSLARASSAESVYNGAHELD